MRILITGGAGFVGAQLAQQICRAYPSYSVFAFDNLSRRGSEMNIQALRQCGVSFIHGDIRLASELANLPEFDLMIDCSADPSVIAGIQSPAQRLIESNLFGTVNLLELASARGASFIFLSTSRVYTIGPLSQIRLEERETRYGVAASQALPGVTEHGIATTFPLAGSRSFYGAAKLASELLIQEYVEYKALDATIFRCGVIAGPGQFGRVDQGVIVFWLASHLWNGPLAYFGYGGTGKQVRDALHINDLYDLIDYRLHHPKKLAGKVLNVGGGHDNSYSLQELTRYCEEVTGNSIRIKGVPQNRVADIPYYVTDNREVTSYTGWLPRRSNRALISDTFEWILQNEKLLKSILMQ